MAASLLEKINADAQAAAAAIEAKALAEVAAIEAETKTVIAAMEAATATELAKQKENHTLVSTSKARQARNIALQAAKREAIESVFAAAFAELVAQPSAGYVADYTTLWQNTIPSTATILSVLVPANRLEESAAVLQAVGVTVAPTAAATVSAGCLVTASDGVYDLTLDRRFAEARPELEMQVVAAVAQS